MYLSETYEKKWQPVLDHPDLPEVKDSYKRAVTSVILENQERALKEDQASKIEDLEKKLNEEIEKNVEMNKVNGGYKRQEIIDENSKDLADTAKEKFDSLIEGVEYSSEEDFAQKVKTIKESYFEQKAEKSASADIDDVAEDGESNPDLSDPMAAYTNAISKTKDIKISK